MRLINLFVKAMIFHCTYNPAKIITIVVEITLIEIFRGRYVMGGWERDAPRVNENFDTTLRKMV